MRPPPPRAARRRDSSPPLDVARLRSPARRGGRRHRGRGAARRSRGSLSPADATARGRRHRRRRRGRDAAQGDESGGARRRGRVAVRPRRTSPPRTRPWPRRQPWEMLRRTRPRVDGMTGGHRRGRRTPPRQTRRADASARTGRLGGGRGTALGGCGGRRLRGFGCSEGGGVSRRSTAVDETTGRPQPCPRGRGAARRAQRTSPWRGRADGGGRCERGHATVAADTTLPRPRGTAKRVQWRMRPREEETAVRPGWRPSGRTRTRGRPGRVRGHWQ